jgi:hypothetical protein
MASGEAHAALKETALPRRMLGCARDKRGYPIPFLMMPEQQIHIDGRKQERCVQEKLCMICGKKLDNKKWFIGGQMAAMNRLFSDPAMHEECARYALKVCPFLSNSDMKYRKKYDPDTTFFARPIPGTSDNRSPTQVLMRTNGYRGMMFRGSCYVLANRWDYVEHWSDGKQVETPPGYDVVELSQTNGVFDPGGPLENAITPIPRKS